MAIVSATASAQDFATRQQAMDYISTALAAAVAANPSYLTKSSGARTRWFTDKVSFETDADGAVVVTMHEHFVATKDGKSVEAKHEARFSSADVHIDPYLEVGDVTPAGAAAVGIAIACKTRGCIAAVWGEVASKSDSTDFYVQDVATRDRLLAAFRRLQTP
jgi:hypothetical protein